VLLVGVLLLLAAMLVLGCASEKPVSEGDDDTEVEAPAP